MAMAEEKQNYAADIEKYSTAVNAQAVDGIVKKLGLTQTDAELDAALNDVMTKMKGVREKSRVTVCYLLAEKFDKLGMFVK